MKFELTEAQQIRFEAWSQYHWEVLHKGWAPRVGNDGFAGWFMFGPTGVGCNVKYQCEWCHKDEACREIDLTEDDDGKFIVEYDEHWNEIFTHKYGL